MTSTLVDSNILIDLLNENSDWGKWSGARLAECFEQDPLVINPVIYAEASISFADVDAFDRFVESNGFVREPISWLAAFVAGKAQDAYRMRGGARDRTLPDFFIGAHAATSGHRLLTRDGRRYRGYFPGLRIIAPD